MTTRVAAALLAVGLALALWVSGGAGSLGYALLFGAAVAPGLPIDIAAYPAGTGKLETSPRYFEQVFRNGSVRLYRVL